MTRILVIAEVVGGELAPITREALGLAQSCAGLTGAKVDALLISRDASHARELIEAGAETVFHSPAEENEYDAERWIPIAETLARELKPDAILMGHTPAGADLAPRLATRLDSASATGCLAVERLDERFVFTRAGYGGNVRERVAITASPAVATLRAGAGTASADASRTGRVVALEPQPGRGRVRITARHVSEGGKDLEKARVIVAGGRGLGGPEGFPVLETLANTLGGSVGASRVPCDLGWCPHSWQIGLTGKTVTPELYIAVGISGASHHLAGCGNRKVIVAINSDADAAIFKEARLGIVGDYRKVIPALVDALAQAADG